MRTIGPSACGRARASSTTHARRCASSGAGGAHRTASKSVSTAPRAAACSARYSGAAFAAAGAASIPEPPMPTSTPGLAVAAAYAAMVGRCHVVVCVAT